MNIREAILKAADHIERTPKDFEFMEERKPSCGSPGCALGWIGCFLSVESDGSKYGYPNLVAIAMGIRSGERRPEGMFYERMNALSPPGWKWDEQICATALREYADKYHPAPKLGIPASVRAIFDAQPIEQGCLVNSTPNQE